MNFFQKHKKNIFLFVGISIISIALIIVAIYCFFAWRSAPWIIPIGSDIVYTKDEMIDMYWENKDELTEVAEIVLASDSLLQKIIDTDDDGWSINHKMEKQYFSEEDWEKVVVLFKKIRPYMIIRKRSGAVFIDFAYGKKEGHEIGTSLRYFNDKTAGKYTSDKTELRHLDGYWYMRSR